jgi:hypothetical protein
MVACDGVCREDVSSASVECRVSSVRCQVGVCGNSISLMQVVAVRHWITEPRGADKPTLHEVGSEE